LITTACVAFLKDSVSPLRNFSIELLQSLVAGSQIVSFEAHQASAHQGDEAPHFGVVLSGTRQLLGRLPAGATFNEMALMTGDAVLADFIAGSRCEVPLIPLSLFQSVIVAEPGAVHDLSRTIAERMKHSWPIRPKPPRPERGIPPVSPTTGPHLPCPGSTTAAAQRRITAGST
jgi:hypothetical protein